MNVMTTSHEYSIIGHSRSNYGRHLGTVAAAGAGAAVLLIPILTSLIKFLNIPLEVPSIIYWPLTAGLFYAGIHKIFDTYAWKYPALGKFFGIPNISGSWKCEAETVDQDGTITYSWNATVTIHQTWEKIKIYLDTGQSSSVSKIATICPEHENGFRLVYSYQNEPKAGEPLQLHVGFADLRFGCDLLSADGEYYNVKGRRTLGRMTWTKAT